jgi:hypothetical protein
MYPKKGLVGSMPRRPCLRGRDGPIDECMGCKSCKTVANSPVERSLQVEWRDGGVEVGVKQHFRLVSNGKLSVEGSGSSRLSHPN